MLAFWGLPTTIADLVRHHHEPGSAAPPLRRIAAAVHVAAALARPNGEREIDHAALERVGVTELVPSWLELAGAEA